MQIIKNKTTKIISCIACINTKYEMKQNAFVQIVKNKVRKKTEYLHTEKNKTKIKLHLNTHTKRRKT